MKSDDSLISSEAQRDTLNSQTAEPSDGGNNQAIANPGSGNTGKSECSATGH